MIRKFYLRLLGYKPEFRHPLHRAEPLALTPQDIERRKHKHAVLQARITAYAEKLRGDAATATVRGPMVDENPEVGSMDAERRVEGFIADAELAVDRAFYNAGL